MGPEFYHYAAEEFYPLHYAAGYACPRVINLMLYRGARTDISPRESLYVNGGRFGFGYGKLPLKKALETARQMRPFQDKSDFKLLVSLCTPRMKSSLEVCKLLALSSKNVANMAWDYVSKGELSEFAILLMVAREKVLAPIPFCGQYGDDRSKSMTFHQCLLNKIGSLIDEEWKMWKSPEDEELNCNHEKKMDLSSAAVLVDVFEKAGEAIEEYVQSQQGSEVNLNLEVEIDVGLIKEVEKDVGLRLQGVGFTLKDGDFDFSVRSWMNSHGSVRTPIKQVETPSGSCQWMHPPWSLLQQRNYHPRIGLISGSGYSCLSPSYPVRKIPILFSMKNPHSFSSWDVQANKQAKTIEHGLLKFISREKLAYISMLIKSRIRSA